MDKVGSLCGPVFPDEVDSWRVVLVMSVQVRGSPHLIYLASPVRMSRLSWERSEHEPPNPDRGPVPAISTDAQ